VLLGSPRVTAQDQLLPLKIKVGEKAPDLKALLAPDKLNPNLAQPALPSDGPAEVEAGRTLTVGAKLLRP
jgi:hypothetical protein